MSAESHRTTPVPDSPRARTRGGRTERSDVFEANRLRAEQPPEIPTAESAPAYPFEALLDRLSTLTNHGKILSQEYIVGRGGYHFEELSRIKNELQELEKTVTAYLQSPLNRNQLERLQYYQGEVDRALAWMQSAGIATRKDYTKDAYQHIPQMPVKPVKSIFDSYKVGYRNQPHEPPPPKPSLWQRMRKGWSDYWKGY